MISDVELELDSHVRKDVLHGIVSVHINVRSFSFVRVLFSDIRLRKSKPKQGHCPKESVEVAKGQPRSQSLPSSHRLEQGWQRGRATKAGLRLLIHTSF